MDLKSKIILIYGPTASGKSSFAIKLAKKRSIGPFRKSELNDKLKMKEYGILSRAGFSYSLCKKVLNELNLEEIDLINNEG